MRQVTSDNEFKTRVKNYKQMMTQSWRENATF